MKAEMTQQFNFGKIKKLMNNHPYRIRIHPRLFSNQCQSVKSVVYYGIKQRKYNLSFWPSPSQREEKMLSQSAPGPLRFNFEDFGTANSSFQGCRETIAVQSVCIRGFFKNQCQSVKSVVS